MGKSVEEIKEFIDKELHKITSSYMSQKPKEEIIKFAIESIKILPKYIDLDKLMKFNLEVDFLADNPIVFNVFIDDFKSCDNIETKIVVE